MHIARTILSLAFLMAIVAFAQAQPATAATQSVTYDVSGVDGSGIAGTVFVGAYGPSTTIEVVSLEGKAAGDTHPAHLHRGDCGTGGGIEVPLTTVDGDTGMSVTLTDIPYDAIVASDLYLNVHRSPARIDTIVACGEVGTGVQPIRRTSTGAAHDGQVDDGEAREGAAQDAPAQDGADAPDPMADQSEPGPAEPEDFATPATASYGLFQVEGSDIRGQVQLTELVGQGTKFVVTLVGIQPGSDYGLALYEGDCGPDRPKVRDLEPVGEREDDPYVSITDTALPFPTVTEGDYFLYVFRTPEVQEIVACGEVGRGANR